MTSLPNTQASSSSLSPVLRYLSLPPTGEPSPSVSPITFLEQYIHTLPPNLLALFSPHVSPKQRTVIPTIRNRRLKYSQSGGIDGEFTWESARRTWPSLWKGPARDPGPPPPLPGTSQATTIPPRPGEEAAGDERDWVNSSFLDGSHRQHVGKLGELLGEYEQERQAEQARLVRRRMLEAAEAAAFEPEEEEEEEEEIEDADEESKNANERSQGQAVAEDERVSFLEAKADFERSIKEKFIYGLLDSIDYDAVDWDDKWDDEENDRDEEDRWFDEESEGEG